MIRHLACALLAAVACLATGYFAATGYLKFGRVPEGEDADASEKSVAAAQVRAWEKRLRERRLVQLQNLKFYADAGVYPINLERSGRIAMFVDEKNTACAVGHLMRASGRDDIVREIRLASNYVYVKGIKDGLALDWILTSGLTQEECAYIQPEYERMKGGAPKTLESERNRIYAHLNFVHSVLVSQTESSLNTALVRLRKRLDEGPIPETFLHDVEVIELAPHPRFEAVLMPNLVK